jgi:hypothetical protein
MNLRIRVRELAVKFADLLQGVPDLVEVFLDGRSGPDAGSLLLKSPKLKRTLAVSIRREKDPIVRWLKLVHASQKFTKKFHLEHRSGNEIETTEVGHIEFLPNVSVRVARRCAAMS